jgi:DNA polymerase-3 subunit beta
MVISARADEVGDNTGTIDASVQGEESKIAFSGKYLTDVLSVLGTNTVALETTTSSSPGVVRPVGSDGSPVDDDYVHVVMPMFVQW